VTFEAFLQELADPGQPLAASKLIQLSNLSPDQVSIFQRAWFETDLSRRRRVIDELINLAEDNVELNFDALLLSTITDNDPDVRVASIRGLWEHAGKDLLNLLLNALERDPDAGVRAEAALALGRFVLEGEFDRMRQTDTQRLDAALQNVVRDPSEIAEVRGRALEALGARSEDWVQDAIQDAFESDDRRLRLSAVHAMGRTCDPAWLPLIFAELESDDPEMRFEAAGASGTIGDDEATPHLIARLEDDDAEVQLAAIAALGEIGDAHAVEALQELVTGQDDEGPLRDAALAAIAEAQFADDPLGLEVET
jgi:HEAT repeat protein